MKNLTERQLKLLVGSVDLSISSLGSQIVKLQAEKRIEARKTLAEYLEIQEELNNIKTK